MLRYFYILVCIQLCFSSEYIDKTEYEVLERRVRNKNRLHRKHTRSTKKSRVVQFDVENFMERPDEDAVNDGSYAYRNRMQEKRPANYGDYGSFIESNDANKETNKAVDYSNIDDNGVNIKSTPFKEVNARHFNFHSFDDRYDGKSQQVHNHDRAVNSSPDKLIAVRDLIIDPEKKCSFKNMKMPFFSYNKSTTKGKRQKKRKLFCFNCHKTSSTTPYQFDDSSDIKTDDSNKNPIGNGEKEFLQNKVSKRAYGQLCPKCIRELLFSLRKKTTKKANQGIKSNNKETKATTKAKTTLLDKPDTLEDNLEGSYNNPSIVRQKRSEEEERDRRLKELEEVERKIDDVHVTSPTFMKISLGG